MNYRVESAPTNLLPVADLPAKTLAVIVHDEANTKFDSCHVIRTKGHVVILEHAEEAWPVELFVTTRVRPLSPPESVTLFAKETP